MIEQSVERNVRRSLTAREAEVFHLYCQGKSEREIGQSLQISANTVHGHLRLIRIKLRLSRLTVCQGEAMDRRVPELETVSPAAVAAPETLPSARSTTSLAILCSGNNRTELPIAPEQETLPLRFGQL